MYKRFILLIAIGLQYTECSTVLNAAKNLVASQRRQSKSQAPVKPQQGLIPPQQTQLYNNNLHRPNSDVVTKRKLDLEPQSLDLMNTEEKSLFKDKLGRLGRANLIHPPKNNDTDLTPQIRFAFVFEGDELILDKQNTTIMHYDLKPEIAANLIEFIESLGYSPDVQKKIFEDIKNTVAKLESKSTMGGPTSVKGATFKSTKKMIIKALEEKLEEKIN